MKNIGYKLIYPFIKNTNHPSKTNTQEEGKNNGHYSGNGSGGANGGVCGGSISTIWTISMKNLMRKRNWMRMRTKRNWTTQKNSKKNWTRRMNAIYVTLYSIPSKNYSAKK
jgi:hypothetical protein